MRRTFLGSLALLFALGSCFQAFARDPRLSVTVTPTPVASPSAMPTESLVHKEDITQPTQETKGRLERILDEQRLAPLGPTNILRVAIRQAVAQGVAANTIVLLLLFPVVATMIAAARHLIGLRGFGVFTPAVVSVAFLATGLRLGVTLFVGILAIAMLGRAITRILRLQYLPQMALLILVMSLGVLVALIGTSRIIGSETFSQWGRVLGLERLSQVGIFPILLLVLLTETFISAQISHGIAGAARITIETMVLATASYFLLNSKEAQEWVLVHPELTVVGVGAVVILMGRYTGLRVLEYWRFRELARK